MNTRHGPGLCLDLVPEPSLLGRPVLLIAELLRPATVTSVATSVRYCVDRTFCTAECLFSHTSEVLEGWLGDIDGSHHPCRAAPTVHTYILYVLCYTDCKYARTV